MFTTTNHAPSRTGIHKRSISTRTLDSVLETALCNAPISRPSSASSQSSFSTAYTTLEKGKCFRYYLPHISTDKEAVYTRNDSYACNTQPVAPFTSRPPAHYGRFYHYVPGLSGDADDAFTDGVNVLYNMLRGPGRLAIQSEQKVWGGFKHVDFDAAPTIDRSPSSYIGPKEFPYQPKQSIRRSQHVRVDSGSCTVGDRRGKDTVIDPGWDSKARWSKEKYRRPMSLAGMSEKVREMLKKMHIGNKAVTEAT